MLLYLLLDSGPELDLTSSSTFAPFRTVNLPGGALKNASITYDALIALGEAVSAARRLYHSGRLTRRSARSPSGWHTHGGPFFLLVLGRPLA